ncbi:MAG: hypothetical protein WC565_03150 [Parcubacteria group bacterium]
MQALNEWAVLGLNQFPAVRGYARIGTDRHGIAAKRGVLNGASGVDAHGCAGMWSGLWVDKQVNPGKKDKPGAWTLARVA